MVLVNLEVSWICNSARDYILDIKKFLVGDELEGIEVAQMMDEKDQGLYGAANKHYGSLGMYPEVTESSDE